MIWKAVDDAALVEQSEALTSRLAAGPTEAIALMKRAFAASAVNGLEAQLELEAQLQGVAGAARITRRACRPSGKRAPRFPGRK